MVKMLKLGWPAVLLCWLGAGCASTFSNLTPQSQPRNANNLYPVEVTFHSRQQSLLWESIQPTINVGTEFYPMRPTLLMTNRWEGLVPIPPGQNQVDYRYKFDFKYNAVGQMPQEDSAISPYYTLRIKEGK